MKTRFRRLSDSDLVSRWFRGFCLVFGIACTAPLFAQSILCVERDGKLERVRHAEGKNAVILESGKFAPIDGSHFVLHPTPDFLPGFIKITDRKFQKGANAISDDGPSQSILVQAGRFFSPATLNRPGLWTM